jgi:putative nucleotidyltransferase with HDIG domain
MTSPRRFIPFGLGDNIMDSEAFLRRLDTIPDIPTLPKIAIKMNKMLQEDDVSIIRLSQVIENDQAMVTKILRLVNSSFYQFKSKIETIPRAIAVLGLNTIRNAVLSVSFMDAFRGEGNQKDFDISEFWRHSIAVGVTSRHLAERTGLELPDDCFVVGLLHDIGKVVLAQYFREEFGDVVALHRRDGITFYEAEKIVLPLTHAEVGGHLAEKWQLPDSLTHAIRHHHGIGESGSTFNLSIIVYGADRIVNTRQDDSGDEMDMSGTEPAALEVMAKELRSVEDWFPEVEPEIELTYQFMVEDGR